MSVKRIVIKIGTSSITYDNGALQLNMIDKLARVISDIRNSGKDVILVSSGAIAVGAARLGLKERPRDICGKQAASAVGQGLLMQIYEKIFMEYNQIVAQVLLTKDVIDIEERKIHAKNTMDKLLEMNVIPIVNENDAVSSDELLFCENDTLSAYVSTLVDSDLLIILSDIDGLYDSDPNKNKDAKIIAEVNEINDYIRKISTGSNSKVGTGGMSSKIDAISICFEENIDAVIASSENPEILYDIVQGEKVGTKFIKK